MREDIKTTWIIAGLLVAVMGISSLMADGSDALAKSETETTKMASGTTVAKKITKEDDACGWMSSLFSNS